MTKLYFSLVLLFISTLSWSQKTFTPEALQADSELLWQALNELHPGLYRHTAKVVLEQNYEDLQSYFKYKRTANETFLALSKFTANIKCGHTYLNPFNQNNTIIKSVEAEKVLLPFTFSIIENKIIVNKSLDANIQDKAVITHINEWRVSNILNKMTPYIKSDGNRQLKKLRDLEVTMTSKFEYFDYYFALLYGFENELTLTLNDGTIRKVNLLTKEERKAKFLALTPNFNFNNYDDLWSYTIEKNYAYLKLGTFVTWRISFDWEAYLDTFFEKIEKASINHLIIDIRGNEGGVTDVNKYLIKKLAKTEGKTVLRRSHIGYKKVSDKLRPHLYTWSRWFYNTALWTKKLNDEHRTFKFSSNKAKKIRKNSKAFKGQTFLLVNESNSSATFTLAEICKENNYATLVGTETGGTKQGINGGQMFFMTLPNTRIEVDIPLIGYYASEDLADEGIQPDVIVKQSLEAYLNGEDEALNQVFKMIGGN